MTKTVLIAVALILATFGLSACAVGEAGENGMGFLTTTQQTAFG